MDASRLSIETDEFSLSASGDAANILAVAIGLVIMIYALSRIVK